MRREYIPVQYGVRLKYGMEYNWSTLFVLMAALHYIAL